MITPIASTVRHARSILPAIMARPVCGWTANHRGRPLQREVADVVKYLIYCLPLAAFCRGDAAGGKRILQRLAGAETLSRQAGAATAAAAAGQQRDGTAERAGAAGGADRADERRLAQHRRC